jgi:predicted DCC family thiol-disulfide oxidoreductase YuxK
MPALNLSAPHQPQPDSAYCSDQNCPYCRELRAMQQLMDAGKQFRLKLIEPRKKPAQKLRPKK